MLLDNNNAIIAGTVALLVSLLLAATGWNFVATADMPKIYVTHTQNTREHEDIKKKLDAIMELILKLHVHDEHKNEETR